MSSNNEVHPEVSGPRRFQPNFLAYAKAHGRKPEQQLEHDRKAWPGGCMCGFILWISQCRQLFKVAKPAAFLDDTIVDCAAWEAFLTQKGRERFALKEGAC